MSSNREIITINIGQCGIQNGHEQWLQYCVEHDIDKSGELKSKQQNKCMEQFFEETKSNHYKSRNLMVDLESNAITNIQNSAFSGIYHTDSFIYTNHDHGANNNFATAHYVLGKQLIMRLDETIRKETEKCESLQGFIINQSISGGTGSGLSSLCLERLSVDYRKKPKFSFTFLSDANCNELELYNMIMGMHYLIDHTDVSLIFENDKISELISKYLNSFDTFEDKNELVSKVCSSFTNSLRFDDSAINFDMNAWETSLVGFPRLHFVSSGMAPLIPKYNVNRTMLIDGYIRQSIDKIQKNMSIDEISNIIHNKCLNSKYNHSFMNNYNDIHAMTDYLTDGNHYLNRTYDYDREFHWSMGIVTNFHGNISPKQCNATIQWLKQNRKVAGNPWVPTGFNVGLYSNEIKERDNMNIASKDIMCFMFGTNVNFGDFVKKRMCNEYYYKYMNGKPNQQHLFTSQGMEIQELYEAVEDVYFLYKDYKDCVSEQPTDSEEEEQESSYNLVFYPSESDEAGGGNPDIRM